MSDMDMLTAPGLMEQAKAEFVARNTFAALALIDRHLDAGKPTWSALMLRARILERLGRFEEAQRLFAEVLELNPGNETAQQAPARIAAQSTAFEAARVALAEKRPEDAYNILQDLSTASASLRLMLTARALFAMKRFTAARASLEKFLSEQPNHQLGRSLLEKIGKHDAETPNPEPRPAAMPATGDPALIEALAAEIASLEAGLARGEPVDRQIAAIRAREPEIAEARFQDDVTLAKAAHFAFATDPRAALANYNAHLIEKSVEFAYITWPKRIQSHIRGKSVLDVGCGFGAFGNGFLVAGAADYTGVDPQMPLDSPRVKNKRIRKRADLGMTPREVMSVCPNIHLVDGVFEDFEAGTKFDVIVLHNVTEHLMQIGQVMAGIRELMTPQSRLIFHHHNFFCWNGHHQAPNQPAQYDETNDFHRMYADWRHILIADSLPPDHYFNTGLNQIRLDELKELIYKDFNVEVWQEVESSAAVAKRLIPSRMKRVEEYDATLTRRDLMVNAVFCVARVK